MSLYDDVCLCSLCISVGQSLSHILLQPLGLLGLFVFFFVPCVSVSSPVSSSLWIWLSVVAPLSNVTPVLLSL